MNGLLALAGYARSGKDQFAAPLLEQGWVRHNMGDHIKSSFRDFTEGRLSLAELEVYLSERVSSEEEEARLQPFLATYAEPYAAAGHVIDPFTEDDAAKRIVRPILEHGGDVIHTWIDAEFFRGVDTSLSLGQSVVNTRLCRVQEGVAWHDRGGLIVEVRRSGWPAATDWDRVTVTRLQQARLIDQTIHNTAFTGDAWAQMARNLAPTAAHLAGLKRADTLRGAA